MKTKVCPYCDQPIKGMYCKGCKRVVLEPVEYEMTYYLNQRHPEHEKDCSYHGDTMQSDSVRTSNQRMTPWEAEDKKAQIKARMEARKLEQKNAPRAEKKSTEKNRAERSSTEKNSTARNAMQMDAARERERKEAARRQEQMYQPSRTWKTMDANRKSQETSGVGKRIFIGILIYLIIVFGGSLIALTGAGISNLGHFFKLFSGSGVYETVREPESASAWEGSSDLNEWERSAEEVQEAGEACTGYGHFRVIYTEEEGPEYLKQLLEEMGFHVWEEMTYTYNSEMTYDSWYQMVYSYTIETDEEYIGSIEIDTDTATGQIHGFSVYSSEEDHFYGLADVVLNYIEEMGIVSEELPQGAEFYEELSEVYGNEIQEQGFAMMYGMEAYCYLSDENEADFFSMSLHAPGYRTEE